jgi:hypothetical protein
VPLQNVLAVQQAGPCDDLLITEPLHAVLPFDELDQVLPKNKDDARVGIVCFGCIVEGKST